MIRFENNDYLLDLTIDTACEILYPEAIQYIMFVSWKKIVLKNASFDCTTSPLCASIIY